MASPTRELIEARLAEARQRTFALVEPLSDDDLHRQHDPLMSPIIWDLGHIAHFEELWLVRNIEGPVEFGEMPGLFDPFAHPRRVRGALQLPSLHDCRALMRDVRSRVLDRLHQTPFDDDNPLLRAGYVYSMVLQHEYQHAETILQTLQLKQGAPYCAPRARTRALPAARSAAPARGAMVGFPGGRVRLGTDDRGTAYDNERPSFDVEIAPFSIDVYPVTNGEFMDFMRDGGYTRRALWSDAGWSWLTGAGADAGVEAPKYWFRDGSDWCSRVMDVVAPVDRDLPVCHLSYHEAEAFARHAGKRLPTEQEWEVAAGWDAAANRMRAFPWGDDPATASHANVDQLSFGVAPPGAYPRNWSPLGCYGMIGDVWEWTSSDFRPYPGYETFPYKEYSEVFFGSDYKVLRGGIVGHETRRGEKQLPQLGLSRSPADLQRRSVRPMTSSDLHSPAAHRTREMLADVRDGLSRTPRELPSKYFYDERGSVLFEQITRLPEYYPTRAEREILLTHSADIVRLTRPCALIELGAGSAAKTRILLAAMQTAMGTVTYVPVDVSEDFLDQTRQALERENPALRVRPVVADIGSSFELPGSIGAPRLFAFLGSTIGNFDWRGALSLVRRVRAQMRPNDRFLLGTDLRKDRQTLEAAYNDSAGVTAEFNRNILRVLNAELGADFVPERFAHRAIYDSDLHRIEMHLHSIGDQVVHVPGLAPIPFRDGESIRTELSHKYDRHDVDVLAEAAGLRVSNWFTDAQSRFALSILESLG